MKNYEKMDQEDRLEKKRKAKSPQENTKEYTKKLRKNKRKSQKVNELTASSSEDEIDSKGRTPSGNTLTNVRDIRPFFSPCRNKSSAEDIGESPKCTEEHLKHDDQEQGHPSVNCDQAEKSAKPNSHLQGHQMVHNNRTADQSARQPNTSDSEYESSPESISTSSIRIIPQSQLSSPEPELLNQIARNMRTQEDQKIEGYADFINGMQDAEHSNTDTPAEMNSSHTQMEMAEQTENNRSNA